MNETETKMVEIHLTWNATIGVPIADENGNLSWKRQELNPFGTSDFKVKVPEEATKSISQLEDYLMQSAVGMDADIIEFDRNWTNIYDENNRVLFD
tara:strand:+ start:645 stop:932 length:288 start_codon:yes stop_codon:yes gene_type:complete